MEGAYRTVYVNECVEPSDLYCLASISYTVKHVTFPFNRGAISHHLRESIAVLQRLPEVN